MTGRDSVGGGLLVSHLRPKDEACVKGHTHDIGYQAHQDKHCQDALCKQGVCMCGVMVWVWQWCGVQ